MNQNTKEEDATYWEHQARVSEVAVRAVANAHVKSRLLDCVLALCALYALYKLSR